MVRKSRVLESGGTGFKMERLVLACLLARGSFALESDFTALSALYSGTGGALWFINQARWCRWRLIALACLPACIHENSKETRMYPCANVPQISFLLLLDRVVCIGGVRQSTIPITRGLSAEPTLDNMSSDDSLTTTTSIDDDENDEND